jgi:hypothetical protein
LLRLKENSDHRIKHCPQKSKHYTPILRLNWTLSPLKTPPLLRNRSVFYRRNAPIRRRLSRLRELSLKPFSIYASEDD